MDFLALALIIVSSTLIGAVGVYLKLNRNGRLQKRPKPKKKRQKKVEPPNPPNKNAVALNNIALKLEEWTKP